MPKRQYWLDLFTGVTWQEFIDSGSGVSGFREGRWKTVQKIKVGDYLLCYLTGVSRFIGVLEVTSGPYRDTTKIWKDEVFPCRMKVKPVVTLTPTTAVPVLSLREKLTIFQNLKNPNAWSGAFRGSPAKFIESDGEAIVYALQEAEANPVERDVDPLKLKRRPKSIKAPIGNVTIPDSEQEEHPAAPATGGVEKNSAHLEMQWTLLNLGSEMGLDVWAARNDRNKVYEGKSLSDIARIKNELPLQFDNATNKTIELIDVLWLKGNAIVAAFEIESTTSIYSGLLRMADLITMQPNINIPLFIVGPDDRREKVIAEVNRPTFCKIEPAMSEMCRFISFSTLRKKIGEAKSFIQYLKPDFLEELSESCESEEGED